MHPRHNFIHVFAHYSGFAEAVRLTHAGNMRRVVLFSTEPDLPGIERKDTTRLFSATSTHLFASSFLASHALKAAPVRIDMVHTARDVKSAVFSRLICTLCTSPVHTTIQSNLHFESVHANVKVRYEICSQSRLPPAKLSKFESRHSLSVGPNPTEVTPVACITIFGTCRIISNPIDK